MKKCKTGSISNFVIVIKVKLKNQDGLFKKTRKLFPGEKKFTQVSGFALLFEEEPCPLRLQMVF
jgi:hypothetical protein